MAAAHSYIALLGSTFWVELPFGRATNSGSFGENSRPSSATGGKRDSLSVPVPSSEPTTSMDGLDRPELSAQQDVKRVPGGPSEVLAPPTPVSASDARVPSSRLNILVADDDPLTRRLMTRMLTRLDHNVRLAEDGLEALTILREAWKEKDECRFDAIVSGIKEKHIYCGCTDFSCFITSFLTIKCPT